MRSLIDELERLEKAATPGILEVDEWTGELLTRGDWGCRSLLCYDKIPMPGLEAQFRNPRDRDLWIALRNAAPALIAVARAAQDVAECLCLPSEPAPYKTLGDHLRAALAGLEVKK